MLRIALYGMGIALLAGCATSDSIDQNKPSAAGQAASKNNAVAMANNASNNKVPEQNRQPALVSDTALTSALVGSSYVRGRALPQTIGENWSVSTIVTVVDKRNPDFFAVTQDNALVLISAKRTANAGGGQFRYLIKDAVVVGNHSGLVPAACYSIERKAAPIFALINPVQPEGIVFAAHAAIQPNNITEMKQGEGKKFRCTYQAGKKTLSKTMVW